MAAKPHPFIVSLNFAFQVKPLALHLTLGQLLAFQARGPFAAAPCQGMGHLLLPLTPNP